jgi:hypothetical protein
MLSMANQYSAACIMSIRWSLLAPDLFLRTTGHSSRKIPALPGKILYGNVSRSLRSTWISW